MGKNPNSRKSYIRKQAAVHQRLDKEIQKDKEQIIKLYQEILELFDTVINDGESTNKRKNARANDI